MASGMFNTFRWSTLLYYRGRFYPCYVTGVGSKAKVDNLVLRYKSAVWTHCAWTDHHVWRLHTAWRGQLLLVSSQSLQPLPVSRGYTWPVWFQQISQSHHLWQHWRIISIAVGRWPFVIAGGLLNMFIVVYIHRVCAWYIRCACSIYSAAHTRPKSQKWRLPTAILFTL